MVQVNKQSPKPKLMTAAINLFDDAVPADEMADTGHKFLVFGASGTGKTTLACDFPKPLLLIRPEEVEDGSKSIRTVPGVIVTPPMTDPDQLLDICEGQRRTRRYKSIVFDGLTDLQDLTVKKHMGLQDTPVQMTWGLVPQADWNGIGILIKGLLRNLLRLADEGTHIILVAGERLLDGEKQIGIPSITAAMTPGLTGWVHKVCDYNVHTFTRPQVVQEKSTVGGKPKTVNRSTGKVEFCLHVPEGVLYATKYRRPKGQDIPAIMTDPSFEKLDALIRGV